VGDGDDVEEAAVLVVAIEGVVAGVTEVITVHAVSNVDIRPRMPLILRIGRSFPSRAHPTSSA
jgi:hypothetical protein